MGAPVRKELLMQPMLLEEFWNRDRLVEIVNLSHEAELRSRRAARVASPRATVGAALVRAGLKLDPAAGIALSPRSC